MNDLPWGQPGRFYKGNIHTHSDRSDSSLPPAEVVAAYRDHGYDFLSITDHFSESYGFPITDTRPFRTDAFTTLIGAELHAPALENGQRWHLVAVGLPFDFAPPSPSESGPDLAARAAAAGAFVGIAHPAWYGLTLRDALSIESAHAVEIYNETCLWLNDRPDGWVISDMLSANGRRLSAYASDDAHFRERPDWRAAWVHVRAAQLDPGALLAALKAGQYYSSQGPQIHDLRIDDGKLYVACSPAAAIVLSGPPAKYATRTGDGVSECEFPLERFAGEHCRVTVVGADGKRAWSNPIWLTD
jgi:hypothetical protein